MPSMFAWVDFAEEDRRKMAEVVDLFREQETRDELGLGIVRDALSDLLFPGTSTIQTRARYFLFVPWIYRRHQDRGTAGSEVVRRVRRDEVALTDALSKGGERDGVIGIRQRANLQRFASSVYWAGLGTWRIRRFNGSQQQYHRAWDFLQLRRGTAVDDDKEPINGANIAAWDPELPREPKNFLTTTTLSLSHEEAEYLQQRILGLGQTLLGYLVNRGTTMRDLEYVWAEPGVDSLPVPFKEQVEHARLFSEAMYGAALLYNLMLSEERADSKLIHDYQTSFRSWVTLLQNQGEALRTWRRNRFWALVESTQAHVSIPTQRFINAWLDLILETADLASVAHSQQARDLVRKRELVLKRSRARLGNPGALERWNGSAGAQQLNYRWHRVRAILADIRAGLEGSKDA